MPKIQLSRPVEHEGTTYTDIMIDEPSLGAIEALETAEEAGKGNVGAMLAMLAVDTGWPEGALRKIRVGDLKKISETITPFVQALGGSGEA